MAMRVSKRSGRRRNWLAAWKAPKLAPEIMIRALGFCSDLRIIRKSLQNPSARIMISGGSFGAFQAANQFLRRPDLFDTLIAMSGFYDLAPGYLQGFMSSDAYFNNPMSYLPNMH